jgi:ABC-2 type transport system ATP-binding protein
VAEQRLDLTLTDAAAFADVSALLGSRVTQADPTRLALSVPTDGSAVHVRGLLDEIDPGCRAVRQFAVHVATLDDVFLALTGSQAAAAHDLQKETVDV